MNLWKTCGLESVWAESCTQYKYMKNMKMIYLSNDDRFAMQCTKTVGEVSAFHLDEISCRK